MESSSEAQTHRYLIVIGALWQSIQVHTCDSVRDTTSGGTFLHHRSVFWRKFLLFYPGPRYRVEMTRRKMNADEMAKKQIQFATMTAVLDAICDCTRNLA
eukprot:766801-Hanusia_phi.AAC.5